MAKFLSFNIVNTGAVTTEGPVLVNVDLIRHVAYATATGILTLGLSATATSSVAFLIKNVAKGAAGAGTIPAITSGTPVIQAVNRAITANPGGIKAGVTFGKDQTGGVPPVGQAPLATNLQMYAATATFTA